jgi:hypothetical protein
METTSHGVRSRLSNQIRPLEAIPAGVRRSAGVKWRESLAEPEPKADLKEALASRPMNSMR